MEKILIWALYFFILYNLHKIVFISVVQNVFHLLKKLNYNLFKKIKQKNSFTYYNTKFNIKKNLFQLMKLFC